VAGIGEREQEQPSQVAAPQGGDGPSTNGPWHQRDYHHPAAGWGAAKSVGEVLVANDALLTGPRAMLKMNHEDGGFDCPGCAWPDDLHGIKLDLCENGVKHVTWEMRRGRTDREFFARHTVAELSTWTDTALEKQGRLIEPMVYDPATDHYVPISWQAAFDLVGRHLQSLGSPDEAAFYTSGRLSNEATFLYQWWVREFGTNNLPDCSNMCHEASGRALTAALGTGKGTADLDDWYAADALFIMGVNAGSNAPRMLTALADAYRRGAQIVHVNPLIEAGATRTIIPHEFGQMARNHATPTSTLNVQVRIGGDLALLRGIGKTVLERAETDPSAVDRDFIERYTDGFEAYRQRCEATTWAEIQDASGLTEAQIREAAEVYLKSKQAIVSWCLGVSQQEHAVDTIREIVDVLLLRGNLGRPGTGPSPVRGHSNVQGNRTCGIDNNPSAEVLDLIAAACEITPPRAPGLGTVGVIDAMHSGAVKVFVCLGGNFALAAPDTAYTTVGLQRCELTVQVSTTLNRSHLVHGRAALILPCLGRTEVDEQAAGPQSVSVEDAMSMVHLSRGYRKPASPHLRSEPAIIAGMAMASLPGTRSPWAALVEDYDRIRDVMAVGLAGFEDFNTRVRMPHGFRIAQPARELEFHTPTGRAEFSSVPLPARDPGFLALQTMRSHDQWNTTIYSDNDRYRGVSNLRTLVFMNAADMAERGLAEGDLVDIVATSKDGSKRSLLGYRALAYDLPKGDAAGYMPEMNALIGRADFSAQSDQPLMKHLRVRIAASTLPADPAQSTQLAEPAGLAEPADRTQPAIG
jgi:molybdopterin-dependent oxidoreductase alpha subunit